MFGAAYVEHNVGGNIFPPAVLGTLFFFLSIMGSSSKPKSKEGKSK
jgi:hypothetical protein